ncbi:hypothetical protein [Bacteroides sp. An322]|uniref:hypothetical protein n=1 Tax=Bacteroides sp. An322 TaxID=1965632 RepID=UPI000B39ECFC|nr:hypothetical protein [Bacteroides sp. An322]OUO13182.1 hypothetical protein B5F91_14525 [Bacteroides sp. An322]
MNSKVIINDISPANNVVYISFTVDKNIDKYFRKKNFIYSCSGCEIVPKSILVIPFVCNVLPIIWLTNSNLIIQELDKTFFNSIQEFKKGYINMYPQLEFKGNITANELINNYYEPKVNLVLLSGGIDAICTVLRHQYENLNLLTLWGSADFPTNDTKGWNIQWENIKYNAKQLGFTPYYIKTNFCDFIPLWGKELSKLIKPVHGGWWHEMQHGIGILGHAAPYLYIHKIGKVYIASSFDESRKPYTCASDPTIDNFVAFGSTQVVHDGYEWNRQNKIHYIVKEGHKQNLKFKIHVCLRQYQIENCCHCEKCYRTILGLLAEGVSPTDYNFNYQPEDLKHILYDLKYNIFLNRDKIIAYKKIQERILENQNNIKDKRLVDWFKKTDLNKINQNLPKMKKRIYQQMRHLIGKILRNFYLIK